MHDVDVTCTDLVCFIARSCWPQRRSSNERRPPSFLLLYRAAKCVDSDPSRRGRKAGRKEASASHRIASHRIARYLVCSGACLCPPERPSVPTLDSIAVLLPTDRPTDPDKGIAFARSSGEAAESVGPRRRSYGVSLSRACRFVDRCVRESPVGVERDISHRSRGGSTA
jgi:hypothetical protein